MKTIEEFVFDKYLSQQSKAEKHKIDASNYIDWAHIAVEEAQRFIPLEEEKPENQKVIAQCKNGSYMVANIASGEMAKDQFEYFGITHWRPLFHK